MTIPDGPAEEAVSPYDHTAPPLWVWVGDLDAADAPVLGTTWQSLLTENPASVIIDVSGVSFLDCAVLSVLVRANNDSSTHLLLRGVPPCVDTLLQSTGLDAVFTRTAPSDSARLV